MGEFNNFSYKAHDIVASVAMEKPVIVHSDIPAEFRDLAILKAKEALASSKVCLLSHSCEEKCACGIFFLFCVARERPGHGGEKST